MASSLGQAVWLMTVSKAHRDLPIREIEARVSPAVMLQQFRIFLKGKQPIAFLSWAAVSGEVEARFANGDTSLAVHEWRSGENVVIIDCVSPFAEKSEVEKQFWSNVSVERHG